MRRFVFVVVAVSLAAGSTARAQQAETTEAAEQPRVLEWLNLEFGMAPASLSLWFGAHTWWQNKYLVGVRAGARQSVFERDLNGDGTIDYAKSLGTNPLQFELQGDFAIPIRRSFGWRVYGTGLRKLIKTPTGTKVVFEGGKRVPTVHALSVATGARVAVGGDELQVGLPLGLRYSYRVLTRGVQFREWWASLRALMFVPSFRVGMDAEFAYMLGPFGFSVFFEYFPQLHDEDPAKVTCQLGPQVCRPSVPVTVFNRIPNEGMILGGLRIRLTKSF